MNYNIVDIFPTGLITGKFDREFNSKEKEAIDFYGKYDQCHKSKLGSSQSNNTNVLDDKRFADIKAFIQNGLKQYMQQITVPQYKVDYKITQSWLTYTIRNDFLSFHNHRNSLLSGTFYLNADPNLDRITFASPFADQQQITIAADSFNARNTPMWSVPVETGMLIIYPSHLKHAVEPVQNEQTRISLSFNAFATGELGHETSHDYAKIG